MSTHAARRSPWGPLHVNDAHSPYDLTTDSCAADVAAVALPVLRHRVITTFNAEASGVTSDQIIKALLEQLQKMLSRRRKRQNTLCQKFKSLPYSYHLMP